MFKKILAQLAPTGTKLVAVSKTKPDGAILKLYEQGQRIFGENRVQDLTDRQPRLPAGIQWHFIGHLQTNKVKYIAPFIACIHSVDSLKLLKEINKQAQRNERSIDCLLQFHIAEEETKFGLDLAEAQALFNAPAFQKLKNVRITGVMGMATFTDDQAQVQREFRTLKGIFDKLKSQFFDEADSIFREISMGMSGDFETAIAFGATSVRVGSAIFGSR